MKFSIKIMFLFLFSVKVFAGGFDDLGSNARAVSMGGAFIAIGNAPYALFYNPAGIYDLTSLSLSSTYSNLYPGITDDNLNYFTLSGVMPVGILGNFGLGAAVFNSSMWKENIFYASYAREIYKSFAVGGNLKLLGWSAAAAPGESALSYFGFTFDAGASYTIKDIFENSDLRLGAVIRNITEPDISSSGNGNANLPAAIGGGAAFVSNFYNYIVSVDAIYSEETFKIKTGAEFTGLKQKIMEIDTRFLLRVGFDGIIGDSPFQQKGLNGGFGLYINNFKLDYAYVFPLELEAAGGSHKFSLSYSL
jgi:hypothetical protein